MKRVTLILGIVVPAGVLIFVIPLLGLERTIPTQLQTKIPNQKMLAFDTSKNFRQGPNECGPYAAAAFASIIEKTKEDPHTFAQERAWTIPGGYTHPRVVEDLLRAQGIDPIIWNADSLSNEDRISFLQDQIADESPVLLLLFMYGYQHFITVVGYDASAKIFAIYDPVYTRGEQGMTVDDNGSLPGNRVITESDLLDAWSKGGVMGFYKRYAISVKNASSH